jgi:hypothetical protein
MWLRIWGKGKEDGEEGDEMNLPWWIPFWFVWIDWLIVGLWFCLFEDVDESCLMMKEKKIRRVEAEFINPSTSLVSCPTS